MAGEGCNAKAALSVEQKIAAYFIRMGSGDSFRIISELLGIGLSTAIWHCWKVALAIVEVYGHLCSQARYKRALPAIQEQFRITGHGWLGVVGAIDCTHIVISKPAGPHAKRWRDRNRQFSCIVQAVCAPDLKFYDAFVGFPGSAHDQHVFAESPLGRGFREGTHPICTHEPIPYRRTTLKPYLLGDSGYKQLPTLVTPYSSNEEAADGTGELRTIGTARRGCA